MIDTSGLFVAVACALSFGLGAIRCFCIRYFAVRWAG